jgi:hypothetical protein
MATFRNASSASGNSNSVSVSKPTGLTAGDVQYFRIDVDGSGATIGTPSGGATWTQVGTTQSVTNGDGQTVALFRQIAGSSEPASYTVSVPTGNWVGNIVAYSGADGTTPQDTFSVNNPNSASPPASAITLTGTGITTANANETVLFFGGVDWDSSSAMTWTAPSGFTSRSAVNPAGNFCNSLIAEKIFTSAGATGNITATGTLAGAHGNFVAFVVALKDAAQGAALQATASSSASSSGTLTTGLALAGNVIAQASAEMASNRRLFSDSVASASSSASLATSITTGGGAASSASASATLTVPVISRIRQWAVFDTNPTHGGANTWDTSFSQDTLAGSTILVLGGISDFNVHHTLTCTDSQGNTYSQLDFERDTGNYTYTNFILQNAPSIPHTATITVSSDSGSGFDDYTGAWIAEVENVKAASLIGHSANMATATSTSTDSFSSGNIAGGTAPALMVAWCSNTTVQDGDAMSTPTPFVPTVGTGFTQEGTSWQFDLGAPAVVLASKHFSNPGTVAATFTPPRLNKFAAFAVLLADNVGPPLAANASSSTFASATLTTGIAFGAAASSSALSTGLPTTAISLSGAASSSSSAASSLNSGGSLAAIAVSTANSSGTLTGSNMQLAASALSQASSSGILLTRPNMQAAAGASASAAGNLTSNVNYFSGSAAGIASSAGNLSSAIQLSASSTSSASASARVAGQTLTTDKRFVFTRQRRNFTFNDPRTAA